MYNHDVFKAASEGKATHREPLAKFGLWFLGYTSGQTNRNTHHNTQFPFSSGVTNDRYESAGSRRYDSPGDDRHRKVGSLTNGVPRIPHMKIVSMGFFSLHTAMQ